MTKATDDETICFLFFSIFFLFVSIFRCRVKEEVTVEQENKNIKMQRRLRIIFTTRVK